MAAPKGNVNARKGKEWSDHLRWALENYEGEGVARGMALRTIATKVVEQAVSGDKDARDEIANRLDGKPHQSMDIAYTESPAEEMDDAELLRIAAASRKRAAKAKNGAEEPTPVH